MCYTSLEGNVLGGPASAGHKMLVKYSPRCHSRQARALMTSNINHQEHVPLKEVNIYQMYAPASQSFLHLLCRAQMCHALTCHAGV